MIVRVQWTTDFWSFT